MTKTEIETLEERLRGADPLVNTVINPNAPFTDEGIVVDTYNLNDTLGWAESLMKEPRDAGDRDDLYTALIGPELSKKYAQRFSDASVMRTAKRAKEDIQANAAAFTRKNLNRCMTEIENSPAGPDLIFQSVMNGTIYRIKGDTAHNEVYDRVMDKRELEKALKEFREGKADGSKLNKMADKFNKGRKLSAWARAFLGEFMHEQAWFDLFWTLRSNEKEKLAQATIVKNGKVDVKKGSDVIRKSYEEGWRLYDLEVKEGGDATGKTQSDMKKYDLNPFGTDIFRKTGIAKHDKYINDIDRKHGQTYRDQQIRWEDRQFAGMGGRAKAPDEEKEYGLN